MQGIWAPNPYAGKNPPITFDAPIIQLQSCPSISEVNWFQNPLWIPKSKDA